MGIISQHHAGLVPNIDKDKLKTGMLIPHTYDQTEELKALFPGVIIYVNTPPQERGVVVLGSILRNSHKDYVKVRLEHTLREAINTYALPLLHLHNLQDRYHIMHKSFMQRFTHLFRTLRAGGTGALLPALDVVQGWRHGPRGPPHASAYRVPGLLDLAPYVRGRGAVEAFLPWPGEHVHGPRPGRRPGRTRAWGSHGVRRAR
jgi:hypothetical protein